MMLIPLKEVVGSAAGNMGFSSPWGRVELQAVEGKREGASHDPVKTGNNKIPTTLFRIRIRKGKVQGERHYTEMATIILKCDQKLSRAGNGALPDGVAGKETLTRPRHVTKTAVLHYTNRVKRTWQISYMEHRAWLSSRRINHAYKVLLKCSSISMMAAWFPHR